MHEEIGSYDAKTRLSEILRRVKAGECFTITQHGKPVADLVPSRSESHLKTKTAINNILKSKKHRVSDKLLKQWQESGRQ